MSTYDTSDKLLVYMSKHESFFAHFFRSRLCWAVNNLRVVSTANLYSFFSSSHCMFSCSSNERQKKKHIFLVCCVLENAHAFEATLKLK